MGTPKPSVVETEVSQSAGSKMMMMIDGFYSQNGRGPKEGSQIQARRFPNFFFHSF
jgi:hypothetical protein